MSQDMTKADSIKEESREDKRATIGVRTQNIF